jgi:hypothetical protein
MAGRAKEIETDQLSEGYGKPFASALLEEDCEGGKALTAEARAALKNRLSAPE